MNPAKITFEIHMHGALKDFFQEMECLEISTPPSAPAQKEPTLADLQNLLKEKKPEAVTLLNHCRWGLDNRIVPEETPASPESRIDLLPPSSGG